MRRPAARLAASLASIGVVLLAACSDQSPTALAAGDDLAMHRDRHILDGAPVSAIWQDTVNGAVPSGAQYGLYVPQHWNGDVVYYAHGFIAPDLAVALPTNDDAVPFRDALGQAGYAVAYSSYSDNGYDFRDGMQRTRQLRALFTSRYGKSAHDLLVGNSLGGQIVQALAEQHPKQYDGALAMCGVIGGTQLQLDYIGQIRTVFDFMYPGVLPGTTVQTPPITSAELNAKVIGPALAALQTDPRGPYFGYGIIARINQTALAGRNDNERINTLLNVIGYQALGANDVFERAHQQGTFDNTGTVYTSLDPALAPLLGLMNATIARYDAGPRAERWMERNYEPTGELQIPMLTLHKDNDRLVPFRHEAAYRQAAAAAGASSMLVQRTYDDYGHCEFPIATMVSNVQDLAAWVRSGTAPTT